MEHGIRSGAAYPRSLPWTLDQLGQAAVLILGVAVLAFALSGLTSHAVASFALVICGGVLLLSGAGVWWLVVMARRSEARLTQLVQRLCQEDPSLCFVTDRAGATLLLNPAARQRFKGSPDPVILTGLAGSFAAPVEVLRRLLAEAAASGNASQEIDLRRLRNQISVTRFSPNRFLWRLDDLTPQNSIGLTAAGMGLPMLIASRDGHIHFANAALKTLLGGSRTHLSQILPDLLSRPGKVHRLTTASGIKRVRTAECAGPTGRREIYFFPDSTEDDATDWSLADDFPVPMLKVSARGRVVMANRRARDLLGPAPPEGREFSDLVEGLGRSVVEWLTEAGTGIGIRRPEVVRVIRPDRELYLQIRLGRLDGEASGDLVAVLTDLTELKSLESQFVQSQKMQAIGQLAGGVAHDFNNLLTAISGHCDMLLLRHDQDDADHADLQQIAQNANRAAALVSHLLAFSRKQNLQPQVLDLGAVLSDHTHLLKRLMGERVKLSYSAPDDLPPVRADRRQLEQVVMNLAVNSRDAMPAGGEIKIGLALERLAEPRIIGRVTVPEGAWVVLSVCDEGPGIPEDRHQKVFEPFYTTKKAGEGTGLGLSTAYGIVKQSGGYIFVRAGVESGTEMQVWLPALPPGTVLTSLAEQQAPRRDRRRPEALTGVVLLVEDEEPVRAFAGRALRLKGHTVIEAGNAEQALAILTDLQLHVDVIVTDVIMPGMDGPSWAQIARKDRPDVGVIFISGHAEESITDHQTRISGAVFLPKPFSLNQLADTVSKQLR